MFYILQTPQSDDPAFNLAAEEYIVRHCAIEHDYLFVYINRPSVIIGKNQNPFEEINLSFAKKENIHFYRRISGGGTVYHDYGNINFSYITKKTSTNFNQYKQFLAPIVEYLTDLGVPAAINKRNDIVIHDKKISGNAQFTSRDRMLSHGTLLFNANQEHVSKAIRPAKLDINSKSTKSVRSKTTNIVSYLSEEKSCEEFVTGMLKHIRSQQKQSTFMKLDAGQLKAVKNLAEHKYSSWGWNYGRTPKFTVTIESTIAKFKGMLEIRNGLVADIKPIADDNLILYQISTGIHGLRYNPEIVNKTIDQLLLSFPDKEIASIKKDVYPY